LRKLLNCGASGLKIGARDYRGFSEELGARGEGFSSFVVSFHLMVPNSKVLSTE
jgi:hypothetical protein